MVRYVKDHTSIPVLGHADGICCIYLRADADVDMAVKILIDAKTSYPAGCNAVEQLLVDSDALTTVLPAVAEALLSKGVSLRCDEPAFSALSSKLDSHSAVLLQHADPAKDYDTEFLDLVLAVKTIPTDAGPEAALQTAIDHINTHSSHHTDAILTSSPQIAEAFLAAIDSSSVYWNTSTRMADGQRYGFGTEVGISTNKIHSRGPVGLEGLTIYKWVIRGSGQVSAEYGAGGKAWRHERVAVSEGFEGGEWVAKNEAEREVLRRFREGKGN